MYRPAPHEPATIPLAPLCFVTAALSVVIIHLCWLIASGEGQILRCNPYWIDCVSVSETGRRGIAYFVFKGGIIPACVLQGLVWQLNRHWLASLGAQRGRSLPWLGWSAAIALIVYTLSLGHAGEMFRTLRRFGVVLYIALTFMCFVVSAAGLLQTRYQAKGRRLLHYCAITLAFAIASLGVDTALGETYNRIENAVEWWLLMMLNLLLFYVARVWRLSEASAELRVSG